MSFDSLNSENRLCSEYSMSYEDRLRAVQLYIKLGKRIGLTIRQLGYSTKNALGFGRVLVPTRALAGTRHRALNRPVLGNIGISALKYAASPDEALFRSSRNFLPPEAWQR